MISTATISKCGLYRYDLVRKWGIGNKLCAFVGLNPSTADADKNDPTIRRCIVYARTWGFDGLVMINAYAYRATRPLDMLKSKDPIGPLNDGHLVYWSHMCDLMIASWGTHIQKDRQLELIKCLPNLRILKLTKEGFPSHPLYLPKNLAPVLWT